MSILMKAAGILGSIVVVSTSVGYLTITDKWGSVFAILALVITLLKQIIAFIGFLTTAIKLIVILVFVALLLGVGFLALRTWKGNRKSE